MARAIKAEPASEQLRLLKRISWIPEEAANQLLDAGRILRLRSRQTFQQQPHPSDRLFILLSGIAKVHYAHRRERVLVVLLGPGDTFGFPGLLPEWRRDFSCDAVTDCVALTVKAQEFSEIMFGAPLERIGPVLKHTIGKWFKVLARYTEYVRLDTRGRLALALGEVAEKFGVRDARGLLLPVTLSHSELGGLVGASRQHVTMQLRDFERQGVLLREGRRIIVVPERLRAAAEK